MKEEEWMGFEKRLGSWAEKIKPFFDSGGFDPIYEYLRSRRELHYRVVPGSHDTFRVFSEVDKDNLKAIIILQSPYPWIMANLQGKRVVVANGVAMDCRNTGIVQPSLDLFYKGIKKDLYGRRRGKGKEEPKFEYFSNPSLEHLTSQGIMLLNSDLTTEVGLKSAHVGLWKPFMKYFFEEIINLEYVNLPIILAGKQSQALAGLIDPLRHRVMFAEHPASGSYHETEWNTLDQSSKKNKEVPIGVIKKADIYLRDQGHVIHWLEEESPF